MTKLPDPRSAPGPGVPEPLRVAADQPWTATSAEMPAVDEARTAASADEPWTPAPPGGPEPHVDRRSFAERFTGTPWGGPVGPQPDAAMSAAAPAATAARPRRLLWAGGLLLGGSLAAGLLLVATGSRGTFAEPAPTDALPRASVGPVASAEARAAIERFVGVIGAAPQAFELRMRSTIVVLSSRTSESLTGRVVGKDFDVRDRTTPSDGEATEVRVIARGAAVYVQPAGSTAWRKGKVRPALAPDIDIFAGITSADQLAYVGHELRRGHETDHVRSVAWWTSPLGARLLEPFPNATVLRSTLDVWILPDGRPLEVRHGFAAEYMPTFAYVPISADTTYLLTRFGEKVTIQAPR